MPYLVAPVCFRCLSSLRPCLTLWCHSAASAKAAAEAAIKTAMNSLLRLKERQLVDDGFDNEYVLPPPPPPAADRFSEVEPPPEQHLDFAAWAFERAVRDPHNMDCPPKRWPWSPRIVVQRIP